MSSPDDDVFAKFAGWLDRALQIDDLDLMVLKGHLIIEDSLKYLLAAKLRPRKEPGEFAGKIDIRSFPMLARLALVDEKDEERLRSAVRALHEARNKASHWMEHSKFEEYVGQFVNQMGELKGDKYRWPGAKDEQLGCLRKALDNAASEILRRGIRHHTPPPSWIEESSE